MDVSTLTLASPLSPSPLDLYARSETIEGARRPSAVAAEAFCGSSPTRPVGPARRTGSPFRECYERGPERGSSEPQLPLVGGRRLRRHDEHRRTMDLASRAD